MLVLVPKELDSLGVSLDRVLVMLPLSCSASKLEAVVAALTKLSPYSLMEQPHLQHVLWDYYAEIIADAIVLLNSFHAIVLN
ncbi:hypothetical protein Tco_1125427 [Tanacetum coccineum]|uniref:Uncharacterized protein n=1 Tax=Tanacetum coccineum TaxID=301880 RepID=A0ABQ5J8Y6_9ASTR